MSILKSIKTLLNYVFPKTELPQLYAVWDQMPKAIAIAVIASFAFPLDSVVQTSLVNMYLVTVFGLICYRAYLGKGWRDHLKSLFLSNLIMCSTIFLIGATTGGSVRATLGVILLITVYQIAVMLISANLFETFTKPKPEKLAPLWQRITGASIIMGVGIPAVFALHSVSNS